MNDVVHNYPQVKYTQLTALLFSCRDGVGEGWIDSSLGDSAFILRAGVAGSGGWGASQA